MYETFLSSQYEILSRGKDLLSSCYMGQIVDLCLRVHAPDIIDNT